MELLGLVNIGETIFKKTKNLSPELKSNFTFTKGTYFGDSFIIARATAVFSLDELRRFYKDLTDSFDLPVCLYLTSCSNYAIKALVKDGISFYAENRFAYLPFLTILGKAYKEKSMAKVDKLSMVCQHLVLYLIFSDKRSVTVTEAASLINVSKMAISKAFDELEVLRLPIRTEGRTRVFKWDLPWGMLLRNVLPKMSSPVKAEYRLSEKADLKATYLSGISALSKLTSLGDNSYQTLAIIKDKKSLEKLDKIETIPDYEKPEMIVSVMRYIIPYKGGSSIDPISAWLSLPENYPGDARVRFETGRLFSRIIDGWDSSWPLI
ncbi:MAG: membrane protein insertion efficiency factor YidD [Bacilli bacterium]|nr:membrane protein insertion efficiency factor YidD [Bacilli bacterium]